MLQSLCLIVTVDKALACMITGFWIMRLLSNKSQRQHKNISAVVCKPSEEGFELVFLENGYGNLKEGGREGEKVGNVWGSLFLQRHLHFNFEKVVTENPAQIPATKYMQHEK